MIKILERIDKIISENTNYSRKESKHIILSGLVTVNGNVMKSVDTKISDNDVICISGKEIKNIKYIYLVLNKPKGFVSSTSDNGPIVLDLVPEQYSHRQLFPAGRLDKDTTGLMIITDDGNFAHNILSPKKHVPKQYKVETDIPMTAAMVNGFQNGINLSDGMTKEANLVITGNNSGIVTLKEGRYHQIKRMFGCFKAKVTKLERITMGGLSLPTDLEVGQCRELTPEELDLLLKPSKSDS